MRREDKRRTVRLRGIGVVSLVGVWLLCGASITAQEEELLGEESLESAPVDTLEGETDATLGTETEGDFESIDDILAQDEEVLSGYQTYSYDPGTRRDPFRSLLRLNDPGAGMPGERPEGVAGLLIDEIEVEGVYLTDVGPVAQVQTASQETSFLLHPGDQLWDGDVVSISLEEVVFKQSINDPTALRPFREVIKRLNP